MSTDIFQKPHFPGFSFENCSRNNLLIEQGFIPPKAIKTGTTITGILFKDGVILGADTRATEGSIIADKNCEKIHYLADNIYCCGAGTAADTERTTDLVASQLELHRLSTERQVPVCAANSILMKHLFRYQGKVSAALVLGGVDKYGAHLYSIHPHGSSSKLPYATMGSGSLAAMAFFERGWKPDLSEEEGIKLVRDSIEAGILNDLGSGSNIDICVIRKNSTKLLRNYEIVCEKGELSGDFFIPIGTTAFISSVTIYDKKEDNEPGTSK